MSQKVNGKHIGKAWDVSPAAVARMWDKFLSLHGKGYDYLHIGGLLLWVASGDRMRGVRPSWLDWSLNDVYICSELVGELADEGQVDCDAGVATKATRTPHSIWRAYLKSSGSKT
jgi:hypothetical protein